MKKKALLFDVDGVVAKTPHWEDYYPNKEFDFDTWRGLLISYGQKPLKTGISLLETLREVYPDHVVVFLTGRFRTIETETRVFIEEAVMEGSPYLLYMRPEGATFKDMPDDQFKKQVLTEQIQKYFDVTLAVDDRLSISKMYDKCGVPALLLMNEYSDKR